MKQKSVQKLLDKKNVVSVGEGEQVKNGVKTGRPAIVVGVEKKVPSWELKGKDLVPEKVDGEITDVVKVGEIKLRSESPTDRWRPAPGGVSVGHYKITAGTLGTWVVKGVDYYMLSNNHVLANMNAAEIGDCILQPGKHDGGIHPADTIALLSEYIPISMAGEVSDCPIGNLITIVFNWLAEWLGRKTRLSAWVSAGPNKVDCAIARAGSPKDIKDELLGLWKITGSGEASVGMTVHKSGRTTGVTTALVAQKNVTVNVQMGSGKTAIFEDQLLIQEPGFSAPGDSGSAIVNHNREIVGLLFAGSDEVTIFNRYANVKEALGLAFP